MNEFNLTANLNSLNILLDDAIAKARNEGFDEGVKWQKAQTERNDPHWSAGAVVGCPGDPNCICPRPLTSVVETNQHGTTYYLNGKIVTKEAYDARQKENCFGPNCDCEENQNILTPIEEYDNDGRYTEYNDAVWPGEEE